MNLLLNGRRRLLTALFGLGMAISAEPTLAGIEDYTFELVQSELRVGDGAIVDVRLLNTKTGSTVPDAVIFATRIDMAPDNMADMTSTLRPLPSPAPGSYRFQTDLTMAGRWQLSLDAKIQGEIGTLDTKLVLTARP